MYMKKKLINGLVIETAYLTMVCSSLGWKSGIGGYVQTYSYTIGMLNQSEPLIISSSFAHPGYSDNLTEAQKEEGKLRDKKCRNEVLKEAKGLEKIFLKNKGIKYK